MINVLTSLSRISIIVITALFMLFDIILLFEYHLKNGFQDVLRTIQAVLIICFLANCTLLLYMNTGDIRMLAMMVGQLILYGLLGYIIGEKTSAMSRSLTNNILMLLSFGFVELERLDMGKAIRQFIFAAVSIVVGYIVILILKKLKEYVRQLAPLYWIIGIAGLASVLLAGSVEYGAKLSLQFANISIQPSEFIKLSYIFFISACIVKYRDTRGFFICSFGAAAHVLILVLSKDLGGALIYLMIYLLLIFIAYKNYLVLFLELSAAALAGTVAYNMFPHIQTRFIAWSDPLSVVDNEGYQISQSLFAIGTGGWLGSGLCKGSPSKIPVVSKDFIFAAICEEMGTIVGLCLIVIVACSFFMIFNAAYKCTDSFYMLVLNGIAIMFALQAFLNIGGVIKFIPSTGVTLPLVSYGGSSLLAILLAYYIVESAEDLSDNKNRIIKNTSYDETRKKKISQRPRTSR